MITSTRNARIKWIRSLQSSSRARQEAGAFVVEGVRLVEEAQAAGWPARLVLYSQELSERGHAILQGLADQGIPIEEAAPHVMRAASDTQTPQGVLAVFDSRTLPPPKALDFVLIADGVRDPGNLGTILRTALAGGVQAVFLPPEGVDPFSPKVLRAGMGAHFRLPVHTLGWDEIRPHINGLRIYLAAAGAGIAYTQADFKAPLALILGGEAEGAGSQAWELAHEQVHIPMAGESESINVAVAGGVLMFEVVRQRGEINR